MIAKQGQKHKPARKSRWLGLRVDETFEAQLAALQKAEFGGRPVGWGHSSASRRQGQRCPAKKTDR